MTRSVKRAENEWEGKRGEKMRTARQGKSTTTRFGGWLVVPSVRLLCVLAVFPHAHQARSGSCKHPQQSTHTEPLSSPSERAQRGHEDGDRSPYEVMKTKIKSEYKGYAYDFGPSGATFSEPVEITITFDPLISRA